MEFQSQGVFHVVQTRRTCTIFLLDFFHTVSLPMFVVKLRQAHLESVLESRQGYSSTLSGTLRGDVDCAGAPAPRSEFGPSGDLSSASVIWPWKVLCMLRLLCSLLDLVQRCLRYRPRLLQRCILSVRGNADDNRLWPRFCIQITGG